MLNQWHDPLGNDEEKALYNDLAQEIIQWAGWDIVYVQRENFNADDLLGRTDGDYRSGRVIEMILAASTDLDLYNNGIASKFGLMDRPTVVFHCMTDRFEEVFGDGVQPAGGDILFMQHKTNNPKFDEIFEVRKIDKVNPAQFGAYVDIYEISCCHWNMRGEHIDTSFDPVDAHDADFDYLNDNVANENNIIEELVSGLKGLRVEDKDNPFTKTF
jgi:hypothetical protein